MSNAKTPLFDLGRVVATRGLSNDMERDEALRNHVLKCITRHACGDFGMMPEEDVEANLQDLNAGVLETGGGRILSRYHTDGTEESVYEHLDGDIYVQTLNEEGTVYTCAMYCNEY